MLKFFVPGIPVTQGSMKAFIPKGWTRAIVTHDKSKPLMSWRSNVADHAQVAKRKAKTQTASGAIAIEMIFYLPRPKSLPRKVQTHTKKPDLDKLCRSVFDALKGIVYGDDSQVTSQKAVKLYAVGLQSCGVEISVEELRPSAEQPALLETEPELPAAKPKRSRRSDVPF